MPDTPHDPAAVDLSVLAIEARGLGKSFGGVTALTGASLAVRPGEVHALVGENGAGKSTLIKAIGGRLSPDSGELRLRGQAVALPGPAAAHVLGIWTVFQELTLLPALTVAENLMLGRETRRAGLISRRRTAAAADALLARYGIAHIDPLALVEDISLAERQVIEIVRALSHAPEILLLDEPTSSLVEREARWLFEQVRALRTQGAAIVFTSHRWSEIRDIADRITVFRGGTDVGTFEEIGEEAAITLMTGRRVETLYPARPALPAPIAALETRGLSGPRVHGASLTLNRGEILGVGGLAGHGHRELFLLLFGDARPTAGMVLVGGQARTLRSPREAVASGIALVPEDRKAEGLLLRMSVRENATLATLARVTRAGFLRPSAERAAAQGVIDRLRVRTDGMGAPVGSLSGGNQQKVLLGRWLLAETDVLLLYDVTRGVDVATKHEIYALVTRLAAEGRAILFYSSDAEELSHLCHRVLVMREGRIAAELGASEASAERIVSAAMRDAA